MGLNIYLSERQSINDYSQVVDTQSLSLGLPVIWKNIGKIQVKCLWISNLIVYSPRNHFLPLGVLNHRSMQPPIMDTIV